MAPERLSSFARVGRLVHGNLGGGPIAGVLEIWNRENEEQ